MRKLIYLTYIHLNQELKHFQSENFAQSAKMLVENKYFMRSSKSLLKTFSNLVSDNILFGQTVNHITLQKSY